MLEGMGSDGMGKDGTRRDGMGMLYCGVEERKMIDGEREKNGMVYDRDCLSCCEVKERNKRRKRGWKMEVKMERLRGRCGRY